MLPLDSQPVLGLAIDSQAVFLDDVQCIGNESSILDCERQVTGEHNCNQNDGAGVRCGGKFVMQFVNFVADNYIS